MIEASPTRIVQPSIFTDTHPRVGDPGNFNANTQNVDLPFEELGSQRASNNSYGSPRYQKKAPRKKNHKNNNEDPRGDENKFRTDDDDIRGSKQNMESGNEEIYSEKQKTQNEVVGRKRDGPILYSGRDNNSSQRNNEFREPMPNSSGRFNRAQKENSTPPNGKGADASITSSDLTHLVHIPKNINP